MHLINLTLPSLSLRSPTISQCKLLPPCTQKIHMSTNLSLIPPKETPTMITSHMIFHVPFLQKNTRKTMIYSLIRSHIWPMISQKYSFPIRTAPKTFSNHLFFQATLNHHNRQYLNFLSIYKIKSNINSIQWWKIKLPSFQIPIKKLMSSFMMEFWMQTFLMLRSTKTVIF